eukprot:scaffold24040_cov67-Phaeocystis_antarctica.AAC.4
MACCRCSASMAMNFFDARFKAVRQLFLAGPDSSKPPSSFFSLPSPVMNLSTSCTHTRARGSPQVSMSAHSASSRYEETPLAGAAVSSLLVSSMSAGRPRKAR